MSDFWKNQFAPAHTALEFSRRYRVLLKLYSAAIFFALFL